MNSEMQNELEKKYMKKVPKFNPGDTIAVTTIIREKDKQRTQIFKGIVLSIKGAGVRKTFTIRKISAGIGVEKIIPLYSPNVSKIEVIKRGAVRKAKIYYMRKRIGRQALKVGEKNGLYDEIIDEADEVVEEVNEAKPAESKAEE